MFRSHRAALLVTLVVVGRWLVGCDGGATEDGEPPAQADASSGEGGGTSPNDGSIDALASPAKDASAGGDGTNRGSGCPKTSCDAYATSTAACSDKPYTAWKDVCDNAATKCIGPNLPDCFCSSDCDTRRYCFLAPCEQ
jgi:hypothetical protein